MAQVIAKSFSGGGTVRVLPKGPQSCTGIPDSQVDQAVQVISARGEQVRIRFADGSERAVHQSEIR